MPAYGGHAGLVRQAPGGGLRAEPFHRSGRGANERDARIRAGARANAGFSDEKAIARMDRVALGGARNRENFLDGEIAFARRCRTDGISFVGEANVKARAVDIAIDGHGAHTEFPTGALDAHGDLTSVGDQELSKHSKRKRTLSFLSLRRKSQQNPIAKKDSLGARPIR